MSKLNSRNKNFLIYRLFIIILFFIFSSHSFSSEKNDLQIVNKYSFDLLIGEQNDTKDYILAGLKVKLKPGWKIYWRNPGEAGLPTEINWKNVRNTKKMELFFPAPKRIKFFGINTFGYENEVIFPIKIYTQGGSLIYGELKVTAQICNNICIPIEEILIINSNINKTIRKNNTKDILNYYKRVPSQNNMKNKYIHNIIIKNEKLKIFFDKAIFKSKFDLIIEDNDGNILPRHKLNNLSKKNFVEINLKNLDYSINSGDSLVLTYISEDFNFFQDVSVSSEKNTSFVNEIFRIIIISFLAGLIINFMPCVLPVLSLKLANLISFNLEKINLVRKKIFLQILGIFSTFAILFLIISLFKFFGHQVMWGEQFQSQTFLLIISIIIFIFSFSLFGLYEINLPNKLLLMVNKLNIKKYEDFFSGFLMTILATPCTAPYVGSAVVFALSGSYFDNLIVFLFMSLGLSSPLILFLIKPNLINFFPKGGPWLNILKKSMGIIFFLSGIWFLSIFLDNYKENSIENNKISDINWELWNIEEYPNLIKKLTKEQKIIFLDITADWCITCKYNEITVLKNAKLLRFLSDNNVVMLRLDWTKKNETIENFIINKGRFGIPYNEIYSKEFENGILLSELLNKDEIFEVMNKIKRKEGNND